MPLYVTVRAGTSPATSVPVLVVADQRLVQALVDELVRLAYPKAEQGANLSPRYPQDPQRLHHPQHPRRRIPVPGSEEG